MQKTVRVYVKDYLVRMKSFFLKSRVVIVFKCFFGVFSVVYMCFFKQCMAQFHVVQYCIDVYRFVTGSTD